MADFSQLPDEELETYRVEILTEIERRKKRASIPPEIDRLKTEYTAAGGDLANLNKGA